MPIRPQWLLSILFPWSSRCDPGQTWAPSRRSLHTNRPRAPNRENKEARSVQDKPALRQAARLGYPASDISACSPCPRLRSNSMAAPSFAGDRPCRRLRLTVCTDGIYLLDGGAMFGVVPKTLWQKRIPANPDNQIRLGLNSAVLRTANTRWSSRPASATSRRPKCARSSATRSCCCESYAAGPASIPPKSTSSSTPICTSTTAAGTPPCTPTAR